jgi:hypothetical protein
MHHHHTLNAMAGAALAASLLLTFTAHAAGPRGESDPPSEPDSRPCFMQPVHWNEALAGPLPRCSAAMTASPLPHAAGRA